LFSRKKRLQKRDSATIPERGKGRLKKGGMGKHNRPECGRVAETGKGMIKAENEKGKEFHVEQ